MSLTPHTVAGQAGLAEILTDPLTTLVAFDYDGTLAPIVADPTRAVPHVDVVPALGRLAEVVGHVAIVTGRPADGAVGLAGLDTVPGLERLVVLGHYGLQRWEASTGTVQSGAETGDVDAVRARLPAVLESLALADAEVEDKGLSVAVHVRRMPEPDRAFDVLAAPLADLAAEHGLTTEPGRRVIELRPAGMDKGLALRGLADEVDARAVMFTGDDLGDLAAFAEVERRRAIGGAGLLVCSGSAEVSELAERADIVVDGPAGVAQMVDALVELLTTPH
ncbi:MAG: trehalose-phosphatase [Nocardioidaceae bacterium]